MEARLDAGTVDVVCGVRLGRSKKRGRRILYREGLRWIAPSGAPRPTAGATLREIAAASRLVFTVDSCGLAPATRELFKQVRVPIREYPGLAMTYAALEEWADLGIGGAVALSIEEGTEERRFRKEGKHPLEREGQSDHPARRVADPRQFVPNSNSRGIPVTTPKAKLTPKMRAQNRASSS
jgi:hypothetical protein